jgi:hypothetical protein
VDSRVDYNLSVFDPAVAQGGLARLAAVAPAIPGLNNVRNAISSGNQFCTSDADLAGVGAYGGNRLCASTPQDFDPT